MGKMAGIPGYMMPGRYRVPDYKHIAVIRRYSNFNCEIVILFLCDNENICSGSHWSCLSEALPLSNHTIKAMKILVIITYAQTPLINSDADKFREARGLHFGLSLHLRKQQRLWQVCAYAQTRQSLCCLLMQ